MGTILKKKNMYTSINYNDGHTDILPFLSTYSSTQKVNKAFELNIKAEIEENAQKENKQLKEENELLKGENERLKEELEKSKRFAVDIERLKEERFIEIKDKMLADLKDEYNMMRESRDEYIKMLNKIIEEKDQRIGFLMKTLEMTDTERVS